MPLKNCTLLLFFLTAPVAWAQEPPAMLEWETLAPTSLGFPSDEVTALYRDPAGQIWMGTEAGGIGVFDGGRWNVEVLGNQFGGAINQIVSNGQGTVWAAQVDETLWRLTQEGWVRYAGSRVIAIADKPLAQHFGSDCWNSNVIKVEPEIFKGVPYIDGDMLTLALDPNDHLWVASSGQKLVYRFDGEQVSCWDDAALAQYRRDYIIQINALPQGEIWSLIFDSPPKLLVFRQAQWEVLTPEPPFYILTRFYVNPRGAVWIGGQDTATNAIVIGRFAEGAWEIAWQSDSTQEHPIVFTEGGDGRLWTVLAANSNVPDLDLAYLHNGTLTRLTYPHPERFPSYQVNPHLLVADDGRLWLGDKAGLFLLSSDASAVKTSSWGTLKAGFR